MDCTSEGEVNNRAINVSVRHWLCGAALLEQRERERKQTSPKRLRKLDSILLVWEMFSETDKVLSSPSQ